MVAIDFHIILFHTIEVNGYRQLFGYQHSSKYLLPKNHTGLEQLKIKKMMTELNYPFTAIQVKPLFVCFNTGQFSDFGLFCFHNLSFFLKKASKIHI